MQRYRHDELRLLIRQKNPHPLQGQKRQRIAQMRALVILEGMDQVAYGPFIEEVSPGGIEAGRVGHAWAAAVVPPRPGKGNAADGAEGRRHERQVVAAGRADVEIARIRNKGAADMAKRRENNVHERMEELLG